LTCRSSEVTPGSRPSKKGKKRAMEVEESIGEEVFPPVTPMEEELAAFNLDMYNDPPFNWGEEGSLASTVSWFQRLDSQLAEDSAFRISWPSNRLWKP